MIKAFFKLLILRDAAKRMPVNQENAALAGLFAAQAVRSMTEAPKGERGGYETYYSYSLSKVNHEIQLRRINDQFKAFAELNGLEMPSTKRFDDTKGGNEQQAS